MNPKFFWLITAIFLLLIHQAEAQQPTKIPRIGFLAMAVGGGSGFNQFREGLRELGYVEGKSIILEARSAEGKSERLPQLATELVRLNVDVLVTGGGGNVVGLAAKAATTTIPIVMAVMGGDPVAAGLVASIAQPGGNITASRTFHRNWLGNGWS